MERPATDVIRQRFSCLFDLAVPPCMRQRALATMAWGGDRRMVAEVMLACLGRWVSSAHLLGECHQQFAT